MNHTRQARAMFLEDDLWILHGGKINTSDKEKLARATHPDFGLGSAHRRDSRHLSGRLDSLFSARRHAELHVCRRAGHDQLEVGRSHRQPDHQSELLARKWLGAGQRFGLHDTQTLHLLADAARLRRDGTRSRAGIAGEPARWIRSSFCWKRDRPRPILLPRIRSRTIGRCIVMTVGEAAARSALAPKRLDSVGAALHLGPTRSNLRTVRFCTTGRTTRSSKVRSARRRSPTASPTSRDPTRTS